MLLLAGGDTELLASVAAVPTAGPAAADSDCLSDVSLAAVGLYLQVVSISCAHRERDVQLLVELLCRLLGKPTDDKLIRRQASSHRFVLRV